MEHGRRRGKEQQQGPAQHREKSGSRDEEARLAVASCEGSGDLTCWQTSPVGSQEPERALTWELDYLPGRDAALRGSGSSLGRAERDRLDGPSNFRRPCCPILCGWPIVFLSLWLEQGLFVQMHF